jgi:2-oxoglutarate ferredoxin oxidoreductase subunit gamma
MIREIRISGSGGQGVLLAGLILAEAAGIYEGKEVVEVQDYGGQVRGGAVRSDIMITPQGEKIIYPGITRSDILLALSQQAITKWSKLVKNNGYILYDSTYIVQVPPLNGVKIYCLPMTRIAREKLGTDLGTNMIALGALCGLTSIVSPEALEWAALRRAPEGSTDSNRRALKLGVELGKGLTS